MSLKNRDKHNRWRNKTVAFRVSPEEDTQIETFVKLSGLTKQDYITRRLTFEIDRRRFAVRLTVPYSDERRKAASELAKKNGLKGRV